MRTRDELRSGIAALLRKMRLKRGLSIRKMAEHVDIDDHTWSKYETGQSLPNVADFLYICDEMGENILPKMLRLIYPEMYTDDDTTEIRDSVCSYFRDIATDNAVKDMHYLISGSHGSSLMAQIQMFVMIDHLPMDYRVAVADLVDTLWRLAESRGELVETDKAMPDVQLFRAALVKGTHAAYTNDQSYSI